MFNFKDCNKFFLILYVSCRALTRVFINIFHAQVLHAPFKSNSQSSAYQPVPREVPYDISSALSMSTAGDPNVPERNIFELHTLMWA